MHVFMICTGNTCRSPMAEGILRQLLAECGRTDITVESGGLAALDGDAASENAVEALAEIGVDISAHRSRRVTLPKLRKADRIYVMTPSHRSALTDVLPEAAAKIRVVGIDDPYGLPLSAYRKCRDALLAFFRREMEAFI